MKKISKMNYSEFCEYLNGDGYARFEPILEYDEFTVYMDITTDQYYYLAGGENNADEFYELELVAELHYDVNHDIKLKWGETLSYLFDCCVCGECVQDKQIRYLWFKGKSTEEAV